MTPRRWIVDSGTLCGSTTEARGLLVSDNRRDPPPTSAERTKVYNGIDATVNGRLTRKWLHRAASMGRPSKATASWSTHPRPARRICKVAAMVPATGMKFMVVYPLPSGHPTSVISEQPAFRSRRSLVVPNASIVSVAWRPLDTTDADHRRHVHGQCHRQLIEAAGDDVRGVASAGGFAHLTGLPPGSSRRLRGRLQRVQPVQRDNALEHEHSAYGPTWTNVTQILTGPALRLSAHFDFYSVSWLKMNNSNRPQSQTQHLFSL